MVKLSISLDGIGDLGAYSISEAHFLRVHPLPGNPRYIWGIDVDGYKAENGIWLMEHEGNETVCSIFANISNEQVSAFAKKVTICKVSITCAVDEITTWHCTLEYDGENPDVWEG